MKKVKIVASTCLVALMLFAGVSTPSTEVEAASARNTAQNGQKPTLEFDNITIGLGSKFDPSYGVVAKDAEGKNLSIMVGAYQKVDTHKVGKYTVSYFAMDKYGRLSHKDRIINVIAMTNEKPQITGHEYSRIVPIGSKFDPMKDIKATDLEDGDLTKNIQFSGTVDTSKRGVQQLTYSVTDSNGNQTSVSRYLRVY